MRLQKYLAEAGITSRRKAEEMILSGRAAVNGVVIRELGFKIDPAVDEVMFDGKKIDKPERLVYIALHKPEGFITAKSDPRGRPTVAEIVADIPARLLPVGRLDFETSGMLLMTNDGALIYKLTHPKFCVEKVYIAKVKGHPTPQALDKFRKGLIIMEEDREFKTAPASAEVVKAERDKEVASLKITIREGRNRQVRKMCEAIGYPVRELKRVATGKIYLGNLKRGEYRFLTRSEIEYLKKL